MIRTLLPFALGLTLAGLANAQGAGPPSGVTPTEISIGQTLPLSGPVAQLGSDFHTGFKAAIDNANKRGGVHGRKIKLLARDDGYVVARTLESIDKLVKEDGVFAFSGCVGTPNVLALMPVLASQGVPLYAPYTGADAIQKDAGRNMFTIMASYSQETEKMVQHLSTVGLRRIAVAHQQNAFGKSALAGVEEALKRRQMALHGVSAIETDARNAPTAAAELARSEPQAVIVAAAGRAAVEFIHAYRQTGKRPQFLLLSGSVDANLLGQRLGDGAVGIIVTQTSPSPLSTRLKVAQEHRELMKAAGAERLNYTSMMGHIAATSLLDLLKRTGRDLTRERFITAAEGAGKLDLGGYELLFSKDQHHGSRMVDITMIRRSGEQFAYAY